MSVDPAELFQGTIIIVVPHMDDEVLACGGTIAKLPDKKRINLIYATDGMGSPAPILPWRDTVPSDLGAVRMEEARVAMKTLDVPVENIHFLGLPDGQLKYRKQSLSESLLRLISQIEPTHILMPFRYDRHTDHLALNHVLTAARQQGLYQAELSEYFVYHHWRLLPARDVREYIHPKHLFEVDIKAVADRKRAALRCFTSQTTKFYPWQTRPNLTPHLLDEVSRTPELFLRYDPAFPGATIFTQLVLWIRLAHRLEPFMKKKKDQVVALWRRGLARNGNMAE